MQKKPDPNKSIVPTNPDEAPAIAVNFKSRGEESRRQKMIQVRARVKEYAEKFPGQYNSTLVQDLHFLGEKRPDYIPEKDWSTPMTTLTPIYSLMLYMSAWGMSTAEIAKSIGRNRGTVNLFLQTLQAKEEVQKIQERIWGQDPKKWVEQILPVAMKTALDIMTDPKVKAQTRLDAANRFLDRHMGKPLQKIEQEDSMVRKLFELLDQKSRGNGDRAIEVGNESIEEAQIVNENYQNVDQDRIDTTPEVPQSAPTKKDKIDQWVEESLGKI